MNMLSLRQLSKSLRLPDIVAFFSVILRRYNPGNVQYRALKREIKREKSFSMGKIFYSKPFLVFKGILAIAFLPFDPSRLKGSGRKS